MKVVDSWSSKLMGFRDESVADHEGSWHPGQCKCLFTCLSDVWSGNRRMYREQVGVMLIEIISKVLFSRQISSIN